MKHRTIQFFHSFSTFFSHFSLKIFRIWSNTFTLHIAHSKLSKLNFLFHYLTNWWMITNRFGFLKLNFSSFSSPTQILVGKLLSFMLLTRFFYWFSWWFHRIMWDSWINLKWHFGSCIVFTMTLVEMSNCVFFVFIYRAKWHWNFEHFFLIVYTTSEVNKKYEKNNRIRIAFLHWIF